MAAEAEGRDADKEEEDDDSSDEGGPDWIMISPEDLDRPGVMPHLYRDMKHHLYLSRDWSPDFYTKLCRAGFIAVAHEPQDLLVKLNKSWSCIC